MSDVNTTAEQVKDSQSDTMESSLPRSVRISTTQLSFQTSEAFKMLRANIQFSGYGLRAISVTSCNANEGKSFVAFELAKSLAELGKRTLFLDCDIRNSKMQTRLGVKSGMPGLTDFLVGEAQIGDILCKVTNVPKLHIIFAGAVSPNPSELLSSSLFGNLCDVLKKNYDYIIMDTAPLGAVIDAAVIGKQCDGTVLVIEAAGTDRKQAQRVKGRLEAAGIRILGVVLNKAGAGGSAYDYKKYGYGYGDYYGYGEKESRKEKKRS